MIITLHLRADSSVEPPLSLFSEAKQREQEQKAKQRLQEMDEEEYDALTEEEKEHFDHQRLQMLRERKRR